MSATVVPRPSISEQKSATKSDYQWFHAVMARWKIADEFVRFLDPELLPADHALRQVVGEDFPKLMRELSRLRAE